MRLICLLFLLLLTAEAHAAPLCGTQQISQRLPHPGVASVLRSRLHRKQASPPHQVGDIREFWGWDLSVQPPAFRRIPAICKVATDASYVFVEQKLLENGKVTSEQVENLDRVMHHQTPAASIAPDEGILDIEFSRLGAPPDSLDGDPRVFFLVMHMKPFRNFSFDGYFNAFDQLTEEEAWSQYQQHSNEAEVLYLNGGGGLIDSQYMRGVLAHELTHLIEYAYDQEEFSWLSESLAEGAMQLTGYFTDTAHVLRFASKPESPLVSERYANYGAGFLFTAYLQGLHGNEVLGQLMQDAGHGTLSVEGVLARLGHPQAFEDLHATWAAANLRAGLGENTPGYQHPALEVPPFAVHAKVGVEGGEVSGALAPWGFHFIHLAPGSYQVTQEGTVRVYQLTTDPAPHFLSLGEETLALDASEQEAWILVIGAGQDKDYHLKLLPR
jgi:hypothetical protein